MAGSSSPFRHFSPSTAWSTSVTAINKLHIPTSRGHCSLVAFGLSVTLTQEITLSWGKPCHLGFRDSVPLVWFPFYFTGQEPRRKSSRTFYKLRMSRGILGCLWR